MAFDPNQTDELALLRSAAAGLIKGLIRARAVQEPDFLKPEDYLRWKVEDYRTENRPCAAILSSVKQLQQNFDAKYIVTVEGDGLSVACPDDSSIEEVHELVHMVGAFISGDLDEAIRVAKKRGCIVEWRELANWDDLKQIRDALDELPETPMTNINAPCLPGGTDVGATGRIQRVTRSKRHQWRREPNQEDTRKMQELPGAHSLTELCRWMDKDRKTVINLDRLKYIYVQRLEGQKFKLWILGPELFETTVVAMTSDGGSKKGSKKDKKGESGS